MAGKPNEHDDHGCGREAHENHHNGHTHGVALPASQQAVSRLIVASVLTAVILAGEIVGGIWAHSLALLSDAAHVFMDLFALGLSLGALLLARRPADEDRTFGWHRAEVFAALINGLSLIAIAVLIFVEGIKRISTPEPVRGVGLLIIAAVGLATNMAVALLLRQHVGSDLNLKAAFLHIIGDAAASLAVIAGAVVIILTGQTIVDGILALAIGAMLLWGAGRLVRDAVHILFEGTPRGMKPSVVAAALARVEGVMGVHDLHIWSLCSHITNLSAHLVVNAHGDEVRERAARVLAEEFGISHTTLQLEIEPCGEDLLCERLNH